MIDLNRQALKGCIFQADKGLVDTQTHSLVMFESLVPSSVLERKKKLFTSFLAEEGIWEITKISKLCLWYVTVKSTNTHVYTWKIWTYWEPIRSILKWPRALKLQPKSWLIYSSFVLFTILSARSRVFWMNSQCFCRLGLMASMP